MELSRHYCPISSHLARNRPFASCLRQFRYRLSHRSWRIRTAVHKNPKTSQVVDCRRVGRRSNVQAWLAVGVQTVVVRDRIQSSWQADTTWILTSSPETNVGGTPKVRWNDRVKCAESKNPAEEAPAMRLCPAAVTFASVTNLHHVRYERIDVPMRIRKRCWRWDRENPTSLAIALPGIFSSLEVVGLGGGGSVSGIDRQEVSGLAVEGCADRRQGRVADRLGSVVLRRLKRA